MNSLSMICFEHQMDMMQIDRMFIGDLIGFKYKHNVLNEDVELICEGVFDAVKRFISTILEKLRDFFQNIIDFFGNLFKKEKIASAKKNLDTAKSNIKNNPKKVEKKITSVSTTGSTTVSTSGSATSTGKQLPDSKKEVEASSGIFKFVYALNVSFIQNSTNSMNIDTLNNIVDSLTSKPDKFANLRKEQIDTNCKNVKDTYITTIVDSINAQVNSFGIPKLVIKDYNETARLYEYLHKIKFTPNFKSVNDVYQFLEKVYDGLNYYNNNNDKVVNLISAKKKEIDKINKKISGVDSYQLMKNTEIVSSESEKISSSIRYLVNQCASTMSYTIELFARVWSAGLANVLFNVDVLSKLAS